MQCWRSAGPGIHPVIRLGPGREKPLSLNTLSPTPSCVPSTALTPANRRAHSAGYQRRPWVGADQGEPNLFVPFDGSEVGRPGLPYAVGFPLGQVLPGSLSRRHHLAPVRNPVPVEAMELGDVPLDGPAGRPSEGVGLLTGMAGPGDALRIRRTPPGDDGDGRVCVDGQFDRDAQFGPIGIGDDGFSAVAQAAEGRAHGVVPRGVALGDGHVGRRDRDRSDLLADVGLGRRRLRAEQTGKEEQDSKPCRCHVRTGHMIDKRRKRLPYDIRPPSAG